MSQKKETFALELNALETGPAYLFREWPNFDVPKIAAGVYTVWSDSQLSKF